MTIKYSFRFGFSPDQDGFSSMETDRVIAAGENLERPVVRFYTWRRPTISYGLNQNPFRRLEIRRCLSDGIGLVARPTGGREILHGWDLCCSVIWPVRERRSAVESGGLFTVINGILSRGLINLGIDARIHSITRKPAVDDGPCFSQIDRGEISVGGKKIVASAQRFFAGAVLQQSSISVARPACDLMNYMVTGKKEPAKDRIVNSVAYLEEGLKETIPIAKIVRVFKEVFEAELGESTLFVLQKI